MLPNSLPSFLHVSCKTEMTMVFSRPYYKLARLPRCIYYPATQKHHCKTPWPIMSTFSQALFHQDHLKRRGRSILRPCDMCCLIGYQKRLNQKHELQSLAVPAGTLGWDVAAHRGPQGHREAQVTICKGLAGMTEDQRDMHTLPQQHLETKS